MNKENSWFEGENKAMCSSLKWQILDLSSRNYCEH